MSIGQQAIQLPGLILSWIALPGIGSSEAHLGRALVVVAGSASVVGGVGP